METFNIDDVVFTENVKQQKHFYITGEYGSYNLIYSTDIINNSIITTSDIKDFINKVTDYIYNVSIDYKENIDKEMLKEDVQYLISCKYYNCTASDNVKADQLNYKHIFGYN